QVQLIFVEPCVSAGCAGAAFGFHHRGTGSVWLCSAHIHPLSLMSRVDAYDVTIGAGLSRGCISVKNRRFVCVLILLGSAGFSFFFFLSSFLLCLFCDLLFLLCLLLRLLLFCK